jgi:hypothetical protein
MRVWEAFIFLKRCSGRFKKMRWLARGRCRGLKALSLEVFKPLSPAGECDLLFN